MRLHASVVASALLVSVASTAAFVPLKQNSLRIVSSVKSTAVEETKTLTYDHISKLRYRALQRELLERDMDASGTLSSMRGRLREVSCDDSSKDSSENCIIDDEKLATVSIYNLIYTYYYWVACTHLHLNISCATN
jgi:hypothetical protein